MNEREFPGVEEAKLNYARLLWGPCPNQCEYKFGFCGEECGTLCGQRCVRDAKAGSKWCPLHYDGQYHGPDYHGKNGIKIASHIEDKKSLHVDALVILALLEVRMIADKFDRPISRMQLYDLRHEALTTVKNRRSARETIPDPSPGADSSRPVNQDDVNPEEPEERHGGPRRGRCGGSQLDPEVLRLRIIEVVKRKLNRMIPETRTPALPRTRLPRVGEGSEVWFDLLKIFPEEEIREGNKQREIELEIELEAERQKKDVPQMPSADLTEVEINEWCDYLNQNA